MAYLLWGADRGRGFQTRSEHGFRFPAQKALVDLIPAPRGVWGFDPAATDDPVMFHAVLHDERAHRKDMRVHGKPTVEDREHGDSGRAAAARCGSYRTCH